jgi:hypothetical protein
MSSIDARHIAQTVVDSLITAVFVCLLNQSRGHQLLSDVLNWTITITLKFQEEIINHVIPNNMVDDDTGRCMLNWMSWLSTSIDGLFLAWILFLSFLLRFEPKKAHNILCLMLDPQYKNLHIVTPWS